MSKILSIRINFLMVALVLSACASGPSKYAEKGEGPVSAGARNALAAENPLGLVRVGEGFERSGNYAGAMNLYSQALAADPNLYEAEVALARVLVRLGRADDGMAMLDRLFMEHGDDLAVRGALIEASIQTGDFTKAEVLMQPLLADGKATPGQLDLAARLAEVSGRTADARLLYDQALAAKPDDADVLRHLALSFALEGNFETAVALLQKAMDRVGAADAARLTLAQVYALSGQANAALHLARMTMSSNDAMSMKYFYDLLPRMARADQAQALLFDRIPKEALERAAGLAPKN